MIPARQARWTFTLYPEAGEGGGCFQPTLRRPAVGGGAPDVERSEQEASRRARAKLRRYIAANRLNRFATMTYAGEGCFDHQQLRTDVAEFFKGLRRELGGKPLPYAWAPEWHPGGHGLHLHFAVGRYVRQSLIREVWGRGIVHIKLHARSCPARGWEDCSCKPSFQANVWSRRDGKRIRKTFPTLKAATIWRSDAWKGMRDGKLRAPTKDTIRQAGDALIAGMRDGSARDRSGRVYKPATIRSYQASLEGRVYPELGASKLSALNFPDLQDFVDRLAAQGLDGSTIRNTVNPLRVMFRRACYSVPVNPTTGLEIVARGEKPRRVVTAEVAARMVESIALEERALRATAFYAGLRAGELQALRLEDVELYPEGRWGLLHVREAWDKREGSQAPKSAAGTRTVPVCEQLFDVLDEHLLRLGRMSGLIFGRTGSLPFSYSGPRGRAERAHAAAGLEPADLQLHECRHSFKTFLEDAGIRESRVDRYMGHADHSVQGRYSHQSEAKYLEDARALTAFLRRADTPARIEQVRDSRATVRDTP